MVDLIIKQASLAQNPIWQSRVRQALTKAMVDVQGEAKTGLGANQWEKRQQFSEKVLDNVSAFVERFSWATATNSTIAAAIANPIAIVSSTNATPIVVTTGVHGYTTGDTVHIVNHVTNTNANGGWIVTVILTTTFSIPMNGNGVGGATGSVTKQPNDNDLQFTVNSLIDDFAGVQITDL